MGNFYRDTKKTPLHRASTSSLCVKLYYRKKELLSHNKKLLLAVKLNFAKVKVKRRYRKDATKQDIYIVIVGGNHGE